MSQYLQFDDDSDDELFVKKPANIKLGLCCLNTELRDQKKNPVFCSRGMIRKTFSVERAKEVALKNIADIKPMVSWNTKHNISHYRLSSDMLPHFTDAETEPYTLDFCKDQLKEAGDYCKHCGHTVTMHPGQFNQVGAQTQKVFDSTCKDLKMHADILDLMEIDQNGIICIHGGGLYGDKESATRRWIDQFDELPKNVKKRLAIENCEKCYSARDCLTIAQECKIPMIFDSHHYDCYSILHPDELQERAEDLMGEIVDTWKRDDRNPVMHISEQAPGKRIGAHSDYIEKIPDYMLTLPEEYNCMLHIEVEAKMKEKAIKHLMDKYSELEFC